MKEEAKQILRILEALKEASKELQTNPNSKLLESDSPSPAIKALLELGGTESDSLLVADPQLYTLTGHLSDLKSLISASETKHGRLTSFLARRVRAHEISRVAGSVEAEIQAWIDRETIVSLTSQLRRVRCLDPPPPPHEESLLEENLINFRDTLAKGFDLSLQDLLLRSRTFAELEWVVCSADSSKGVQQNAAYALKELVLFNKDVFVGQVLTGQLIKALASMGSKWSLEVLSSLIKAIRSPLVDEIHSSGGIPIIISYLSSQDSEFNIMAMDCVLEIAYFGRKEAIEAMLKEGLIKRLVEMQRSELGGDLIESEKKLLAKHPFASCVARFAVQMEVGEGLRQREKRAMKQEVLRRVKETSASDAEAATIIAEVLWGSSP